MMELSGPVEVTSPKSDFLLLLPRDSSPCSSSPKRFFSSGVSACQRGASASPRNGDGADLQAARRRNDEALSAQKRLAGERESLLLEAQKLREDLAAESKLSREHSDEAQRLRGLLEATPSSASSSSRGIVFATVEVPELRVDRPMATAARFRQCSYNAEPPLLHHTPSAALLAAAARVDVAGKVESDAEGEVTLLRVALAAAEQRVSEEQLAHAETERSLAAVRAEARSSEASLAASREQVWQLSQELRDIQDAMPRLSSNASARRLSKTSCSVGSIGSSASDDCASPTTKMFRSPQETASEEEVSPAERAALRAEISWLLGAWTAAEERSQRAQDELGEASAQTAKQTMPLADFANRGVRQGGRSSSRNASGRVSPARTPPLPHTSDGATRLCGKGSPTRAQIQLQPDASSLLHGGTGGAPAGPPTLPNVTLGSPPILSNFTLGSPPILPNITLGSSETVFRVVSSNSSSVGQVLAEHLKDVNQSPPCAVVTRSFSDASLAEQRPLSFSSRSPRLSSPIRTLTRVLSAQPLMSPGAIFHPDALRAPAVPQVYALSNISAPMPSVRQGTAVSMLSSRTVRIGSPVRPPTSVFVAASPHLCPTAVLRPPHGSGDSPASAGSSMVVGAAAVGAAVAAALTPPQGAGVSALAPTSAAVGAAAVGAAVAAALMQAMYEERQPSPQRPAVAEPDSPWSGSSRAAEESTVEFPPPRLVTDCLSRPPPIWAAPARNFHTGAWSAASKLECRK